MHARWAAMPFVLAVVAVPGHAAVVLEPVAGGFAQPLYATHAGDGSGRLFVVEKAGVVRIVSGGTIRPTPFLDIRPLVGSNGSEQGLLGLAFHPDYATSGRLVVNYTNPAGDSVIARYRVSPDPEVVDPASAEVLLTVDQPFANHNGGHLAFGPDGFLYAGFGDGGLANDPFLNGQNTTTLLGKLLRLDVSGEGPYAIPADNPHAGDPLAAPEVWAHGLRNPWRFSFDRATGDLFIADVGQNAWEEVNFQPGSSPGGENYGWSLFEGSHLSIGGITPPVSLPAFTFPVAEYPHQEGCSVTGGYVYRGTAAPSLAGAYLFGDYCSGTIWKLERSGDVWTRTTVLQTALAISSFGEDEAGEVYVTDIVGGGLFRFAEP